MPNNATSPLRGADTVQLPNDFPNAGALAAGGTLRFGGGTNQVVVPSAAPVATLVLANNGAAPRAPGQVYDALGRTVATATAGAAGTATLVLWGWLAKEVDIVRAGT